MPARFQDSVTEVLFVNDAKLALSVDEIVSAYVPGKSLHESDLKQCNKSLVKFAAKSLVQKYLRENKPMVDKNGDVLVLSEKVHESKYPKNITKKGNFVNFPTAVAVKNSIVTPYSSMIVLINQAQKDVRNEFNILLSLWHFLTIYKTLQMLEIEETKSNKFDRKPEEGINPLSGNFFMSLLYSSAAHNQGSFSICLLIGLLVLLGLDFNLQ